MSSVALLGCGAAIEPDSVDPAVCDRARADAQVAWARLAELTAPPTPPAESEPSAVEVAIAGLQAHALSLEEDAPEAIDGEVALRLSGSVMDALDSLPDVPGATRERIDTAAEALLTDRTAAGSMQASRACISLLEGTREPPPAGALAPVDLAWLHESAASAATGYEESARVGDRHAQRSEARSFEGLSAEMSDARAAAIGASGEARQACRVARSLAVPGR